eukprot:8767039-Pyramimonas_sp.AAC.1
MFSPVRHVPEAPTEGPREASLRARRAEQTPLRPLVLRSGGAGVVLAAAVDAPVAVARRPGPPLPPAEATHRVTKSVIKVPESGIKCHKVPKSVIKRPE